MSHSILGKLFRPLIERKIRKTFWNDPGKSSNDISSFSGVAQSLEGLPAASLLNNAMKGAMESEILSRELKLLMFAVVARTLECPFCISESKKMAEDLGIDEQEFDAALSSLSSHRLNDQEAKLFEWTRETVHFETGDMQRRVRVLAEEVDQIVLLEAIGMASLANTIVRLAVLLG